jgi:hypothetical protein
MLTYIYLAFIGIAFLTSLTIWRPGAPAHLRFFSVLLGLDFCVECAAVGMMEARHNNSWLYNSFMLVEFWAYGYYYYQITIFPWMRRIIRWFLWGFPVFWVWAVFWQFGDLNQWNSYVVIAGSFFTICFSCVYNYQLFTRPDLIRLGRRPEFWIAAGLILFYACNLPFIGMLNFLVSYDKLLAKRFMTILDVLNICMYSFFIYAYLCRIITKRS